jgi:RNA polymerase-binding transcription factor DksA
MRKRDGKTGPSSRARRKTSATTAEVLGSPISQEKIPPKWRAYYRRLRELREELVRRQAHLNDDALAEQPTFSSHMADAGTDNFDRDFALGILSTEQDARYEIERAMERIHEGTYGICEVTGKPIEKERLAAIPWTRFTAKAERELEREGVLKRARLGERETVVKASSAADDDDSDGES